MKRFLIIVSLCMIAMLSGCFTRTNWVAASTLFPESVAPDNIHGVFKNEGIRIDGGPGETQKLSNLLIKDHSKRFIDATEVRFARNESNSLAIEFYNGEKLVHTQILTRKNIEAKGGRTKLVFYKEVLGTLGAHVSIEFFINPEGLLWVKETEKLNWMNYIVILPIVGRSETHSLYQFEHLQLLEASGLE